MHGDTHVANRVVSIVADMRTSFSSGRRGRMLCKTASKKSVDRWRSCTWGIDKDVSLRISAPPAEGLKTRLCCIAWIVSEEYRRWWGWRTDTLKKFAEGVRPGQQHACVPKR